jgi:hypothetical protein
MDIPPFERLRREMSGYMHVGVLMNGLAFIGIGGLRDRAGT